MTYTGKRKGISLVEMTIAVILFALLSTIAMLYYKSLFNIDLTAKKARVAALMDQAYQLAGAYDVFVAQEGKAPSVPDLSEFNATNVLILRNLPRDIRELTTTGWELNTSIVSGRPGFLFPIDLNGTGGYDVLPDDDVYCAIFNHELNRSVELNATDDTDFGSLTTNYSLYGDTFCFTDSSVAGAYKHWIALIK